MSGSPAAPGAAHDYDQFVDWDRRLAREGPFFAGVFEERGVGSVVDVGCGSARHAIMFATWGKRVTAVDPDESMLARARENLEAERDRVVAAGGEVTLLRGGFGDLSSLGLGPADAVTCTGNALPHVAGREGLRAALADFRAVLHSGGVLVLHLLNHSRLLASHARTIPPVVRDTPEGTRVFLRVIGYPEDGETIDFDFVTLTRDAGGAWSLSNRRSGHTALPLELVDTELRAAGFTGVRAFGDHEGRSLELERDESVIMTAVAAG